MTEYVADAQKEIRYDTKDLREILDRLLAPDGCPWDRVQTHASLRKNMIEEAYEAVDAIDSGDPARLADELGDVLLQVAFHAALSEREATFTYDDVTNAICRKLISRHSHVFGNDSADTPEAVLSVWDKNKQKEKGHSTVSQTLSDIPAGLPALMRAEKLQKRAAKVGFDWPDAEGAKAKVAEELLEIEDAILAGGLPPYAKIHATDTPEAYAKVEEEIGDFLFAAVNYARLLGIDPEIALHASNRKFIRRFSSVETAALSNGNQLSQMTLEEMDQLWDAVKKEERSGKSQ